MKLLQLTVALFATFPCCQGRLVPFFGLICFRHTPGSLSYPRASGRLSSSSSQISRSTSIMIGISRFLSREIKFLKNARVEMAGTKNIILNGDHQICAIQTVKVSGSFTLKTSATDLSVLVIKIGL